MPPIKTYPVLWTEELIGERVNTIYGWIILNIVSEVRYFATPWSLGGGGGVKGRKANAETVHINLSAQQTARYKSVPITPAWPTQWTVNLQMIANFR